MVIFTNLFIGVFLVSFCLTSIFYLLALKAKLLPAVRDRDVHIVSKPRIGGVAMWCAIIISLLIVAGWRPEWLQFGDIKWLGMERALWGIIGGLLVILIFGLIDDLRGLSPWQQLLGQFLAVLCLLIAGIGVPFIRTPFNSQVYLVGFWSPLFTLIWVMTMINVMNFFDGLDGLAGSVTLTAAIVLVAVSLNVGFTATAALAVILAGAVAGFLPWNWHPSKIFMGTVGSQMLGFLLGVIAVISGGKVATAVLVLGIPLFDAIVVVLRRLKAGKSPFTADQRHLHHRLLKIGLSAPQVVLLINLVAVTFGLLALHTQESSEKGLLTLLLALLMGAFILITYLLERKRL